MIANVHGMRRMSGDDCGLPPAASLRVSTSVGRCLDASSMSGRHTAACNCTRPLTDCMRLGRACSVCVGEKRCVWSNSMPLSATTCPASHSSHVYPRSLPAPPLHFTGESCMCASDRLTLYESSAVRKLIKKITAA